MKRGYNIEYRHVSTGKRVSNSPICYAEGETIEEALHDHYRRNPMFSMDNINNSDVMLCIIPDSIPSEG